MNIHIILEKLRQGPLDKSELNFLIDKSLTSALNFARYKYGKQWKNFAHLNGSIVDLSIDAITPLFTENSNGEGIQLRNSLVEWETPIENEAHAHFFITKVVTRRIEQEISKKLKEADPFFGKILTSLNYYIDGSGYMKTTYFGETFIVLKCSPKITAPVLPAHIFENIPGRLFTGKFSSVLKNLFGWITGETAYFPAIPFNLLIRKLKKVHLEVLPSWSLESKGNDLGVNIDLTGMMDECLKELFLKVDTKYYSRGKLLTEEADALKKSFLLISTDLRNGGLSNELYFYFASNYGTISKNEFYAKYHKIMDYLLRLLKNDISEKLKDYSLE